MPCTGPRMALSMDLCQAPLDGVSQPRDSTVIRRGYSLRMDTYDTVLAGNAGVCGREAAQTASTSVIHLLTGLENLPPVLPREV